MNLLNDCTVFDTASGIESETVSLKGGTGTAPAVGEHTSSASVAVTTGVQQSSASRRQVEGKMEQLRGVTVEAMSSLLAANIDSGLVHSVGKRISNFLKNIF